MPKGGEDTFDSLCVLFVAIWESGTFYGIDALELTVYRGEA